MATAAVVALARPAAAQSVNLTVNDSIQVADSASAVTLVPVNITVNDSVHMADSATAVATQPVSITVADTVHVADSVQALLPVTVSVVDTVRVADSVAVLPPVQVSVHDSVKVSDSVTVTPPVQVSVHDTVRVSDSVTVLPPVQVSVHDSVKVSDAVTVTPGVEVVVHDTVSVDDSVLTQLGVPPKLGTITAGLVTSNVHTLLGNPADLPLVLDMTKSSDSVRLFVARMQWDTTQYSYEGVQNGAFASGVQVNTTKLDSGVVEVTAKRSKPFTGGTVKLLTLALGPKAGDAPGDTLPVHSSITGLANPENVDLSSLVTTQPAALCVATRMWGDVDGDGKIGSGDAVQILRHVIGLSLASGADLSYGDVDGDGKVTAADAVQVLRYVVGLAVPKDSRVGRYGVDGCSIP